MEAFSLDNIQSSSPQKFKYVPPRVKILKSFDLTNGNSINWFMDTYNFEDIYQEDLHLYVKKEGQNYGDMGIIINAKEDVNDVAIPCISFTTILRGETSKANSICLLLGSWAPADMTGSKRGRENSLGKIGLSIPSYASVQESGLQSYAVMVKAVFNAKALLCNDKKIGKKKSNITTQNKALLQSKGKDLVMAAIAQTPAKRAIAEVEVKDDKLSQSTKKSRTQKSKASSTRNPQTDNKEAIDIEPTKKKQKKEVASSSLQLALVDPYNASVVPHVSKAIVVQDDNKGFEKLESKKAYYPLGYDAIFKIDVSNCFPAPAHFVYRRLNTDWVKILTRDMIKDTKFQEVLGIVMPCDDLLKTPLQSFSKEQVTKAKYWIISGQHSISAAKRLQKLNLNEALNVRLKQQFKYRRCKIILDCPPKISREISKDANISVAKSMQKESFLDQLLQARSQWIANGRPSKPPPGVNTSKKSSKAWEVNILHAIFIFIFIYVVFVFMKKKILNCNYFVGFCGDH